VRGSPLHHITGVVSGALTLLLASSPLGARPQADRGARTAPAFQPPKLAVLIVVDQMRADYIERFKRDWTGGLKRIVEQGAWFTNARYPYLLTTTCAGHATVATGTFPHRHGVVSNEWWDPKRGKEVSCTEDPDQMAIGYLGRASGGNSAYRMVVPSFSDQMRAERASRVVSISMKEASAIMLAGHGEGTVVWLNEKLDNVLTSTAFGRGPVAGVRSFVNANPLNGDFGKTWNRLLPASQYHEPDGAHGENPPTGWTRTFPHVLKGVNGRPDGSFRAQWDRSPFIDAYLGRMAEALSPTPSSAGTMEQTCSRSAFRAPIVSAISSVQTARRFRIPRRDSIARLAVSSSNSTRSSAPGCTPSR
jgi:hypothetical protein